jgi:hypothetical protein
MYTFSFFLFVLSYIVTPKTSLNGSNGIIRFKAYRNEKIK